MAKALQRHTPVATRPTAENETLHETLHETLQTENVTVRGKRNVSRNVLKAAKRYKKYSVA